MLRFDGEAWFFIVLSSLETVHNTVQYSTATVFFHSSVVSWGLGYNVKIPYIHTYERERQYTVNVQCNVQYTWNVQCSVQYSVNVKCSVQYSVNVQCSVQYTVNVQCSVQYTYSTV